MPRAALSPFVGNEIRRGAFYMRPRRFALPQAGTGGATAGGVMTLGGRCTNADGNVPFMSTRAFWFLEASAISTQPPKEATTVILM